VIQQQLRQLDTSDPFNDDYYYVTVRGREGGREGWREGGREGGSARRWSLTGMSLPPRLWRRWRRSDAERLKGGREEVRREGSEGRGGGEEGREGEEEGKEGEEGRKGGKERMKGGGRRLVCGGIEGGGEGRGGEDEGDGGGRGESLRGFGVIFYSSIIAFRLTSLPFTT
jgi:hypothetical protein